MFLVDFFCLLKAAPAMKVLHAFESIRFKMDWPIEWWICKQCASDFISYSNYAHILQHFAHLLHLECQPASQHSVVGAGCTFIYIHTTRTEIIGQVKNVPQNTFWMVHTLQKSSQHRTATEDHVQLAKHYLHFLNENYSFVNSLIFQVLNEMDAMGFLYRR